MITVEKPVEKQIESSAPVRTQTHTPIQKLHTAIQRFENINVKKEQLRQEIESLKEQLAALKKSDRKKLIAAILGSGALGFAGGVLLKHLLARKKENEYVQLLQKEMGSFERAIDLINQFRRMFLPE